MAVESTSASPPRSAATARTPSSSAPIVGSLPPWSVYLLSGAMAGLSVDMVLFPLDTIKTRMQSSKGLRASGGFVKLFAGVASAAAGSAPTAALFFLTYESSKSLLTPLFHSPSAVSSSASSSADTPVNPLVHCLSASTAEVVACLVRVPTENVKQKVQAGQYRTSLECFQALINTKSHHTTTTATAATPSPSVLRNFYRGFGTTIMREIPFAFIQFPLYEYGKTRLARYLATTRHASNPLSSSASPPSVVLEGWQCACVGSMAGGIAAAITTPLDVAKTRIMLQHAQPAATSSSSATAAASAASTLPRGFLSTFRSLYAEGGVPLLFSGVVPRVMWISIGGFVFFGAYEGVKARLHRWTGDERRE